MTIDKLHNIDNEWFTGDKITWFFDVIKWDVKDRISYRLEKFSNFSIVEAQEHFSSQIEWILIDIDDCIAPAYWNILEENVRLIEKILAIWINVWFLSNWINGIERTKDLVEKWALYCNTKESKPSKWSFIEACEMIWTKLENTLMLWDDISKDGWSIQLDENWKQILLWFISVKPIWNSYANIPMKKWINYSAKQVSRGVTNYINREK